MGGNGSADWLYTVGVDTTNADKDLADFVGRGSSALKGLGGNVNIHLNTKGAIDQIDAMATTIKKQLASIGNVSVNIKIGQSKKAFESFMGSVKTNMEQLQAFTAMLEKLNALMPTYAASMEKGAAAMQTFKTAATEARLASRGLAADVAAISKGSATVINTSQRVTSALRNQGDTFTYLQKVAGNTVFKFIEYQVLMQALTGATEEFTQALQQAADVQVEQTLQKLYGGFVDVNTGLHDAIIMAQKWGDKIQDVQQSIGMWSKVTHDQVTAEFLTNEALKLSAASGIHTNDVTTTTISLMSKLHNTAGEIPHIYDMITKAAEMMALPMKNLGSTSGKQEGIRELLEGLTESFSTLHAEGLDVAGAIAAVAAQVQGLGENGKQAGEKLQTMFAGLELGKSGAVFDRLVEQGKAAAAIQYKNAASDNAGQFIVAMEKAQPGIEQAIKDALIHVRPSATETINTFFSTIEWQKKIREALNSVKTNGATEKAAESMMSTYAGHVAQFQTSLQTLTLMIGTMLLPAAQKFVDWLGRDLFPAIEKNLPVIKDLIQEALIFGGVLIGLQGAAALVGVFGKIFTSMSALRLLFTGMPAAGATAGAGFTAMLGPIGALLQALGLLIAAIQLGFQLYNNYQEHVISDIAASTKGGGIQQQIDGYEQQRAAIKARYQPTYNRVNGQWVKTDTPMSNDDEGRLAILDARENEAKKKLTKVLQKNGAIPDYDSLVKSFNMADLLKKIEGQDGTLPKSGVNLNGNNQETEMSKISKAARELIRDYTSLENKQNGIIQGDLRYIDALKLIHQGHLYTSADLGQLKDSYNEALTAKTKVINITNAEVTALQKKIEADNQQLATMTPGTKAYAAMQTAISEESAALNKAQGAVNRLTGEYDLLRAARDKDVSAATVQTILVENGVESYKKTYEQLVHVADSAHGYYNELVALNQAQGGLTTLDKNLNNVIYTLMRTKGVMPEVIQGLRDFRQQIQTTNLGFGQKSDTVATNLTNLKDQTVQKTDQSWAANLAAIANLSGDQTLKSQVDYIVTMVTGMKSITKSQEEINKARLNADPELTFELNNQQQQLDLQRKLLPLLAQAKQIRDSEVYKATDNVIGKYASEGLNHALDNFFGNLYTGKGRAKTKPPWMTQMVADWAKQIADSFTKTASQKITDAIFGVKSPDQTLKDAVQKFGTYVQSTSPDSFGYWVSQFNDGVGTLTGATAGSNGASFGSAEGVMGIGLGSLAPGAGIGGGIFSGIAGIFSKGSSSSNLQSIHASGTDASDAFGGNAGDMFRGSGDSSGNGGFFGDLSNLFKGKAAKGFAVGELTAGILGPMMGGGSHDTWAQVGGAVGGMFGPIWGAVGAAVGSLFGHADDPSKMPDKYLDGYQQFLSGANGSPTGTIPQLEQWLTGSKNLGGLSAAELAQVQRLKALGGPTGTQLGIASEKDGVFTLQSGAKDSVTDFMALVNSVSGIMKAHKGALAPLLSINAYGAGPGYNANPYNTPGLNHSEFAALQKKRFRGYKQPGFYGPFMSASSLPGPAAAGGGNGTTINLVVDGKVLASVVNAQNWAVQNRYNKLEA